MNEQPQLNGDWTKKKPKATDDDDDFKKEMRAFMASMNQRFDTVEHVVNNIAWGFGEKLNLPDDVVTQILNPDV